MDLTFEWDEEKSNSNIKKHKISFEESKTVFNDPLAITILDPQHSKKEHRFIDIGCSSKGKILSVVYTERKSNIRIISSRKATKFERKLYEEC